VGHFGVGGGGGGGSVLLGVCGFGSGDFSVLLSTDAGLVNII